MTPPPNILWVITTQWRAQACGYAGDPNANTPFLDALEAEAVNFVEAVTPHPFGPFARAAMLTGRPSPENGVRDYYDPLPNDARTVAHALKDRGYATAYFGKWHLAPKDRSVPIVGEAHAKQIIPPDARGGFEAWEAFEGGFLLNHPFVHGTRFAEPTALPGYQSDVLCDRARMWIGRRGPWFCVVSLEPPHPPYEAPSAGTLAPPASSIVLPPNVPRGGTVESRARKELAGYYAHIEATDRAIGRLLHAVPRDKTVVVFTSVHGDMHGGHGVFRKGWPYEESIRVPLLVRAPAVPPERDHRAMSLVQLPEMTLGWADGMLAEPSTSESLISMPSVVAMPLQCDRAWTGIRTATRKLVLNADGSPWLFFDLERDPFELQNLVSEAKWQDEMAELRGRIEVRRASARRPGAKVADDGAG
jgi:arylsulfatase A-like enzyme